MVIKTSLAAESLENLYAPAKALSGGSGATLAKLINPLIYNVLIISGLIAFIVIIIAGFNYVSAGGDKGKIEQAQNMLNYSIIGLILVVLAFLITRVIGAIFGFKFF
ncbi:hypothetical protein A3K29_00975 [Candidatus Collierbacteria bacterium RIFOXYB2_FULL_46_14]|uniref:Uncharacterized protein n=1 Tax=Candidatus Collierbacteria bacterium GW2011_GWA2_46_26 TaxID=1618381 RepID=A0A0G1PKD4_9BACT|nr:MAG: hypothetical protein UW29_C0003G0026 [Candidatus Collierbacteria bacterium GW2011_GWC2_44_13]KKU33284.1 MAG: hypothetical protein UX47_C0005G0086 [Candidatus Collierbacteria bacterium GW2011_GWA2_46_26]OGD72704.1 MAG: hypothetical protein A3K29_00975 [Candidatus Collierbacteria bacterium RIFOXYB2_FULL_46_14]OGD75746.1 MAG: hypothetical protein A3K43_00975 [Candidatus Collierbacteria bacterium RIFOXYA2_FULL_46_20]OGD77082.1 MAG: hypothetical protein A3K39_00975 [Candidatus Collierbacteri